MLMENTCSVHPRVPSVGGWEWDRRWRKRHRETTPCFVIITTTSPQWEIQFLSSVCFRNILFVHIPFMSLCFGTLLMSGGLIWRELEGVFSFYLLLLNVPAFFEGGRVEKTSDAPYIIIQASIIWLGWFFKKMQTCCFCILGRLSRMQELSPYFGVVLLFHSYADWHSATDLIAVRLPVPDFRYH